MKIDISELFGGELHSSPKGEEALTQTHGGTNGSSEGHAERESKFQEWMETREKELELKSQELERRLHEIHAQQNLEKSSPSLDLSAEVAAEPETPPLPEPVPVIEAPVEMPQVSEAPVLFTPEPEPPPAPEPAPEKPLIDFNAPIAPPFMGVVAVPAPAGDGAEPAASSAAQEPADPQKSEQLKKLQADHEFLMLYDEFRNIISHELKDLVGEKKTYTMLGRTVELARGKYPEIFRNANWDASGNLLEDGSVDSQRIIDNKNSLDSSKAEIVLDTALSALLNLRLQAVEKGLGSGLKNKVRAHLVQWIAEKIQKAGRDGKDPAILTRLNGYVSQG